MTEKCTEVQEICQEYEQVCIEWETSQPNQNEESIVECKQYSTQCKDSVTFCLEYQNICNSDTIETCSLYSYVDDLDNCE
jgi:hypothetical protein